jgi:LysR family glycine cleavage system transcriptional activator
LESFYGTTLFKRGRHEVVLTPSGERLLKIVQPLLEQLSDLSNRLRAREAQRLSLTAPPSLVSRWLMPRLGGFLAANPQVDFKLHATTAVLDLDAEQTDLAIRYGHGHWPGLRAVKLLDETIFPVATPAYAQKLGLRGDDFSAATLLRDDFQTWTCWFGPGAHAVVTDGPFYSDSALLLQATEAGQGIALGRSVLVADALARGTLVRLGMRSLQAPGAYYVVSPRDAIDTPAISAFREWLVTSAQAA